MSEEMHLFRFCLLKQDELAAWAHKHFPHEFYTLEPFLGGFELRTKSLQLAAPLQAQFGSYRFFTQTLEEAVHEAFLKQKKTLSLAESCTGGALGARLVTIPGASQYFLGSLVVYTNLWKQKFLHVHPDTLRRFGAVSREVVAEMVHGLFAETSADVVLVISGIAGPSGGTPEKPVGTIWMGVAERNGFFDIGLFLAPQGRKNAIDFTIHYALGVLFRRLTYNVSSLS